MNAIGSMFIGAMFVVIGVIAAAAADRIRGVRWTKERAPRETRKPSAPERETTDAVACERSPRSGATPVTDAHKKMRSDVIAALVQSGFTKPEATQGVDACKGSEQSSLESWTRAALKRVMAGAA